MSLALTQVMQKLVLLLCTVASGVLVSTASAAGPTHFSIPIDSTRPSPLLTSACGFDVSLTQVGTLKATIFYDQSGAIIRELDTQPGTRVILSSSATGKSFAFPFSSVFRTDYPNGTSPGSQAIVTVVGLGDKVPGIPADAGPIVFENATVLFVDSNGVPRNDFRLPSSTHGNSNEPTTLVMAICAALAP
jgi:hypothetical protein